MLTKSDFPIEVKKSSGRGRGVFATRTIKQGETIEIAPILMVPVDDEPLILSSFLANYTFGLYVGDDEYTGIALGYASLYNHSSQPNADYFLNTKIAVFKSMRTIAKGEEILIDYGWLDDHKLEVGIKE